MDEEAIVMVRNESLDMMLRARTWWIQCGGRFEVKAYRK